MEGVVWPQSRSERQRYTSDRIMPTATEPAGLESPGGRPYLAARMRSALNAPAPKATSQPRNSRNTNAVMSESAGEPARPPPASTSSIAAARTVGYGPHLFRVAACAATDLALIDGKVGALRCAGVDLARATDGLLLVVELQPLRDPAG